MKFVAATLLFVMSSSAVAGGWSVGPRFGHQNLKMHSEGSEYSSYSSTAEDSGPITLEYILEKDSEAYTNFSNTTVQGIRLAYAQEQFKLISDLDLSRYYSTGSKLDILGLGLAGQYAIVQTEAFQFYSSLGLSLRNLKLLPYETGYSIAFNSIEYSGESNSSFQTNILNYDLALGFNLPLAGSMSLVTEYKYSDSLSKGTLKTSTHHTVRNETDRVAYDSKSKVKNFTITTQELTLGLMFSL